LERGAPSFLARAVRRPLDAGGLAETDIDGLCPH
jgi:hypothetical protein